MSQSYLVVYDYGQGGLWAFVIASSPEEITSRYPAVTVWDEPPSWMSEEELADIARATTIDIDDDQHPFFQAARA